MSDMSLFMGRSVDSPRRKRICSIYWVGEYVYDMASTRRWFKSGDFFIVWDEASKSPGYEITYKRNEHQLYYIFQYDINQYQGAFIDLACDNVRFEIKEFK